MAWHPTGHKRERLSLSAFLRTEDIGVHIVHISRLIITYTLELEWAASNGNRYPPYPQVMATAISQ